MSTIHNGLEIERRFVLFAPPDRRFLDATASSVETIDQVYLPKGEGSRRRVRRIVRADGVDYILTRKTRVRRGLCLEEEVFLSEGEYRFLAACAADPKRVPVLKTRWHLDHAGISGAVELVVDHLRSPVELWVAEIEFDGVGRLDGEIALPEWLGTFYEVTFQTGWSCASVARRGLSTADGVAAA